MNKYFPTYFLHNVRWTRRRRGNTVPWCHLGWRSLGETLESQRPSNPVRVVANVSENVFVAHNGRSNIFMVNINKIYPPIKPHEGQLISIRFQNIKCSDLILV